MACLFYGEHINNMLAIKKAGHHHLINIKTKMAIMLCDVIIIKTSKNKITQAY